jgi:outer membrane receptor for ferrienterochelin and colicin
MKGGLSLDLTAQYTAKQLINANWNFNGTSTRWDVADNYVGSVVLTDARVGYQFGKGGYTISVFGTINNLFDKDPPAYLATAFSDTFSAGTGLGVTGDMRGRRYVLGASVAF